MSLADIVFIAGRERSGTNYIQWLLRENFKNIIPITTEKHYEPRGIIKEIEWGKSQENIIVENPKFGKKIVEYAEETAIIRRRGLPPLAFPSKEFSPPTFKLSPQIKYHVEQAMRSGNMKFLVNIKNPYGWHLSYSDHWKHLTFANHMNAWTDFYEAWAEFEEKYPKNTMFIKHEDALLDFNKVLNQIKNKFNLTIGKTVFIRPGKKLSTTTQEIGINFDKKRNYFANEIYKEVLKKNNKKALDACRDKISKKIAERFGYEIL